MTTVELREWSVATPQTHPALRNLRLDGVSERTAADGLHRGGRLSIEELATGLRITSLSFVGRVQLGSLVVTIEPKLASQPLLALVRYAYGLRDLEHHATSAFAAGKSFLPDLLAAQLMVEVRELLARGLSRRYVARHDLLPSPRGRIDVGSLACRPAVPTALPCRHHVRSPDHHLQRVLLGGLVLAAQVTADRALRLDLQRLRSQMATEVSEVPLTRASVRRAAQAVTRLEVQARPALSLIALLMDGQAVELEGEETLRLPGFLFDMNRFFQALVSRWLRNNLPDCEVLPEHSLSHLLGYMPGFNPRARQAPLPRPDFAVRSKTRPLVLLDAKYRDLWERTLPREMLYQLAMYATSGAGDPMAVILYPTETASAAEARIEIRNVVSGATNGTVALRAVPLERLAELVQADAGSRELEARRLAFGDP